MWNSSKDPKEEKNQQNIETILEENHKVILGRSHLLINIVFVLLGAYALILTAIFFPSYQASSSSTGNSSINNNSLIDSYFQILNQVPSWVTYLFLFLSLASIIIAFGYLWRSLSMSDEIFMEKFEKKGDPIQANLTQRNIILFNTDNRSFSIYLKDGMKLVDRNKNLFNMTENLLKNNDNSITYIIFSLIFFIAFVTLIKSNWLSFIGFCFILFLIMYTIKVENNLERKK